MFTLHDAIHHALHSPDPIQDQYADYLMAQYHNEGIRPMQDGEVAIEYCRDYKGPRESCRCGNIEAFPVVICDQVMAHMCENCWANAVSGVAERKQQYEGMIADGVHPRMASRVMLAK